MKSIGTFPFGQPILPVVQKDCRPKRVFILGVYASAVHARWITQDGRQRIAALGVASEPEIFWRGETADELIAAVPIPQEAGELAPAGRNLNGPSGRALDELFLGPLGIVREDAWLCDLVPHSCMNPGQAKAVAERYMPDAATLGLPEPNWPTVPKMLATPNRRTEIEVEILASGAGVIITLGDAPLKWFAQHYGSHKRLRDYGASPDHYGQFHPISIGGQEMSLLPLAHPRQAGRLGNHSSEWAGLHEGWLSHASSGL